MKISAVSNNNFGMRINDNFQFQIIRHFLSSNHNSSSVNGAISKIRHCADDSIELTFKEFTVGKPCEIWIRKQYCEPEKMFFTFADVKEKIPRRGRPKKKPDSLLYNIASPEKLADTISQKAAEYMKKLTK